MYSKNLYGMVILGGLLTGCAAGPDYVRPSVAMPEKFLGQAQADDRKTATDLAAWWSGFEDPRLTQYVNKALAQNLDLTQALARVTQARAGLSAANASLLPAGVISTQGTRAYQSVETPLGQVLNASPGFDRSGESYDVNLGASWEMDIFGSLRRGRQAAVADYQATEAGVVATRLTVAAQTAEIYISIRGLQARLDIARRQVKTRQDLLATVNRLYSQGLAAEFQVRQAEAALSQAGASIPALEVALDQTMNAFDVMLGTPPGAHREELANVTAIPMTPALTGVGSPADLLRRRPDLIAADRRLEAANARIGVAMAEYYPKLSLTGMIGSSTSVAGSNLFTHAASQSAGILGLRWRLFDFGRIDARIDQAKGQEAELLAAYRIAALHATEDVENALSALMKYKEQTAILAQGASSLDRARGASYSAYQQGVVSLVDVLQADENLLRASDALARAQTDSARAAVSAFKALGGGWQPRNT